MKLAVLTPDSETRYVLDAALRAGDSIHLVCPHLSFASDDVGPHRFAERPQDSSADCFAVVSLDTWEQLLHDPNASVVLFGRGRGDCGSNSAEREDYAERLKRLTQAAVPVVATFPVVDTLAGFETQMIQQDSKGIVIPYFPGLFSRSVGQLTAWGRDESHAILGRLQHIAVQRFIKDATPINVLQTFARDAAILRQILGKIDRINALRPNSAPSNSTDDWNGVSVQMSDADGRIAQWTLWRDSQRESSDLAAEFTFQGTLGRITAACSRNRPFHPVLDVSRKTLIEAGFVDERRQTESNLDDFEYQEIRTRLANPSQALDDWDNACRAMELADSLEMSSRRGKTIQLFHEEHTEISTFKSMMAAGGCLTLLGILAMIPFLALLDRVIPGLGNYPFVRNLPWMFLAIVLVIFLSLQGIIWLTSSAEPPKDPR